MFMGQQMRRPGAWRDAHLPRGSTPSYPTVRRLHVNTFGFGRLCRAIHNDSAYECTHEIFSEYWTVFLGHVACSILPPHDRHFTHPKPSHTQPYPTRITSPHLSHTRLEPPPPSNPTTSQKPSPGWSINLAGSHTRLHRAQAAAKAQFLAARP